MRKLFSRIFRRKCSYFVKMDLVYGINRFTVTHVIDWDDPLNESNYLAFDDHCKQFFRSKAEKLSECKLTIKSITKI